MRTSKRNFTAATTMMVALAFASSEQSVAHDGPSLMNPLRRSVAAAATSSLRSSVTNSVREFDSEDLNEANTHHAQANQTEPAVLAQSLIKTPQTISDQIARNEYSEWNSESSSDCEIANDGEMPPTDGRFVAMPEGWLFVPEDPRGIALIEKRDRRSAVLKNSFRLAASIKDLRAITQTSVELVPTNPLRDRSAPKYHLLSNTSTSVKRPMTTAPIVVARNLMLDRVIDMPHHHPGQLWKVSGRISKVNGQNTLDIRSAVPQQTAP